LGQADVGITPLLLLRRLLQRLRQLRFGLLLGLVELLGQQTLLLHQALDLLLPGLDCLLGLDDLDIKPLGVQPHQDLPAADFLPLGKVDLHDAPARTGAQDIRSPGAEDLDG
jgi:hypothetical protein